MSAKWNRSHGRNHNLQRTLCVYVFSGSWVGLTCATLSTWPRDVSKRERERENMNISVNETIGLAR